MTASQHHIVVIGAGFAGLTAVHKMKGLGARITLIDRQNHHLFQPLLYQAATTVLSVDNVAWPVRRLLKKRADVTVLQAEVSDIDRDAKTVTLRGCDAVTYDTLVIATGTVTSYFGNDHWQRDAPGLKTADDAIRLRANILGAFERAERESDPVKRAALQTFAVIGGGPTGVEVAGMISHLCHHVLPGEFRRISTDESRILLVEGGPRLLAPFDESLSAYTRDVLKKGGVEVLTGQIVKEVSKQGIVWGDGPDDRVDCATIVWAAGVKGTPAAQWLGTEPSHGNRIAVGDDLTLPEDPDIFVIGDVASVAWGDSVVPGLAPAAKQMGTHVAKTMQHRLAGGAKPAPFDYSDYGSLATIGQGAAVIQYGKLRLRGMLAWCGWGVAHIFFLITMRNRVTVMLNWIWFTFLGRNAARVIFSKAVEPDDDTPVSSQ